MRSRFSHVWLFATPWTIARQVPLSMESSRQEYWSGYSLLQEIFPNHGSNLGLLRCRPFLYHLSHQESSPQRFPHPNWQRGMEVAMGLRLYWIIWVGSMSLQFLKVERTAEEVRVWDTRIQPCYYWLWRWKEGSSIQGMPGGLKLKQEMTSPLRASRKDHGSENTIL